MSENPKSPQKTESEIKKELEEALDQAPWAQIAPHAQRDRVIVVSTSLKLLETGLKIALDDSTAIQNWLNQGALSKPNAVQLKSWEGEPQRKFKMLIVQPYVLIQEIVH